MEVKLQDLGRSFRGRPGKLEVEVPLLLPLLLPFDKEVIVLAI